MVCPPPWNPPFWVIQIILRELIIVGDLPQEVSKVFKQGVKGDRVQDVLGGAYCKALDLKRVM
jgi:hypothetical protein